MCDARKAVEHRSRDEAGKRKDQTEIEEGLQERSESVVGTEGNEQVEAQHRRRQYQRKTYQGFNDGFDPEGTEGQEGGQRYADEQQQDRGDQGQFKAEP